MSGRENIDVKGRRLVAEGRLLVTRVLPGKGWTAPIVAECRGDSGEVYKLGYDAEKKQWRCTCPAKSRCSHIVALQLVTTVPKETR